MDVDELAYELPPELIAQHPAARRDASRLLVYERATGAVRHRTFAELPHELHAAGWVVGRADDPRPGEQRELVVVNDTKVVPARIPIESPRGEVLLLERLDGDVWEGLARPTRRLKAGRRYGPVELLEHLGAGRWRLRLDGEPEGETPLPPYITEPLADGSRYQTVYAREPGSAAAPTAGLHFTPEMLEKLRALGVKICFVTLHIGAGTFLPVKTKTVAEHKMHAERFAVGPETVSAVNAAKKSGHRVIAVGTTAVRTLETVARENAGKLNVYAGKTRIFLFPPAKFQIVDALLTNFHLPASTLLMLVSAFAAPGEIIRGRDLVLSVYAEAIRERYRFFSYGDAMFVL